MSIYRFRPEARPSWAFSLGHVEDVFHSPSSELFGLTIRTKEGYGAVSVMLRDQVPEVCGRHDGVANREQAIDFALSLVEEEMLREATYQSQRQ